MTSTQLPVLAPKQRVRPVSPFAEVRRYIVFGFAVVLLLLGGLGVWAASVDLAAAVIAGGSVVVDSNVKKVQHPTGGVIGEIFVKDGQHVQTGELLIRLDQTVTRANLQMVIKLLDEIAVRQARLKAERDDMAEIDFPKDVLARRNEPQLDETISSEVKLFESRRSAREGLKAQLRERISQLNQEVEGLTGQLNSRRQELKFAEAELAGLEKLEGQDLVSTPRITAARRTVAQLQGDIAQVVSQTAQARGRMAEIELQILQLDQDLKTEVGKDLREQQGREAELSERKVAAEDQLRRVEIRSPQNGIVHQLAVHTVGGVISPSEPIMLIVPDADRLVIEAKIAPQDIDQVRVGQTAHVRFSAFNQRTTPDVTALVTRISPDLVVEGQQPGAGASHSPAPGAIAYYSVRLELTDESQLALEHLKLIPGMPAEVQIRSGERTALSYFVKPLRDQFERAFRER
jgi:HlyD family secretion protein